MPERNDDRERGDGATGEDPITERLIDDGDRAPGAIAGAARQGFEEDQRNNPDHPTRIKRELTDAQGVDDPAHSRGRQSAEPGRNESPSETGTHSNRDRSDLKDPSVDRGGRD